MVTQKNLGSLFCEMMEGFLIIDSYKGTILWANQFACSTFGFERKEFVGQHFTRLFPAGSEVQAANVLNEVVCADGAFLTQSFIKRDGSVLYMDLTAALIPWEGESSAIVAVLRDASERKELEELRLESERLRSFAELSAGVAHHFNNMLQVIIGFAGLAQSELKAAGTTQISKKLEQIIISSSAAAAAIKSLQDFARCAQPDGCLSKNVVNLRTLAQRAVELGKLWWKAQPESNRVAISIETDLEDCYANVNQEHIVGAIINLIKNALESFKQPGAIIVGTKVEKDEAIICVRDSGMGINKTNLRKIFDPFWTTKGPRRSGLGLPSAMGIVKQNGGDINVESLEGSGSTFSVRFPVTKSPQPENYGLASKENIGPVTILLIDEEEKVVESLSAGLISKGNVVYTASTVEEGLQVLETIEVDVIVSDEDFQGASGWNFGRKLKSHYSALNREKPPLILLTAWGVGEITSERMLNTGVDRILAKPITIEKLVHNIREILSEQI